jgi:hypothetical protein
MGDYPSSPQPASGPALLRALLLAVACAAFVGFAVFSLEARTALGQDGATPTPIAEEEGAAETSDAVRVDAAAVLTDTELLTITAPLTAGAAPSETAVLVGAAAAQAPPSGQGGAPDQACRLCHGDSTATKTLPSGEVLQAGIDLAVLDNSVHGTHALAAVYCTDCHQPRQRYQFPHAENPAQTLHDFESEIASNCQSCHISIELHNPGHLQAQRAGTNENLPNCVDCHGGHDVAATDLIYSDPVAYCQTCHAIADMEQPQVKFAHEQVVDNLSAEQDCQTCHSDQLQTQSQQCANCHGLLDTTVERTTPDGETEVINLNINAHDVIMSVHGDRIIDGVQYPALGCTECHSDMGEGGFPHPPDLLVNREELRTSVEVNCVRCHLEVGNQFADGIHAEAAAGGDLNAASCADCHGSHLILPPNVPRTRISDTCGTCHEEIFVAYKDSVHGSALYGRNNPDVPVCTDCHGAHQIDDPTTAAFRLSSPVMCGECHANEVMMEKYDISTNVFDSYISDFHGKTVTLFEHTSPNEPTNKAVCYDCHGVHDIQSMSEATEEEMQERILVTCQKCHPDANENFPSSWMSHYEPSLENYPLVYLVTIFYKILIPTVLGGFLLFIGSDVFRRTSDRFVARREAKRGKKRGAADAPSDKDA